MEATPKPDLGSDYKFQLWIGSQFSSRLHALSKNEGPGIVVVVVVGRWCGS